MKIVERPIHVNAAGKIYNPTIPEEPADAPVDDIDLNTIQAWNYAKEMN